MRIEEIDRELEVRVERLALELVEVEWAGSGRRPVLRIRVDFPDPEAGRGVTVDDCARVSRALEPWLDEHPLLPERYVLEVSSPGVERPLHRKRDFVRFTGREIRLKGGDPLPGAPSNPFEGMLEGIEEMEEGYEVLVRPEGGSTLRIPRAAIRGANLVFRWEDEL